MVKATIRHFGSYLLGSICSILNKYCIRFKVGAYLFPACQWKDLLFDIGNCVLQDPLLDLQILDGPLDELLLGAELTHDQL